MSLTDDPISLSEEREGRVREFAAELRHLRRRAGEPSTRALAERIRNADSSTTVGHSTIADVFNGKRLPTWPVASEIVKALDADESRIRDLWIAAAEARHRPPAGRHNEEFLLKYLEQVAAFSGQLQLPGFSMAERVDFEDLYVEQLVTDMDSGYVTSLWSMDDMARRLVLLGDPGSGKSTACRALMYWHARDRDRPAPFLITMRDTFSVVPPERSIVGAIEHITETFFQTRPPRGYVEDLLSKGQALIIFDGLDELPNVAARATSSIIEAFCREFPEAHVVVTSRPAGYALASLDPTQFRHFKLEEFSQDQIVQYLEKLLALDAGLTGDELQDRIENWLSASEALADIRSNPLFLSFASQLYKKTGQVPTDLTGLILKMSDLLLHQWDLSRGVGPRSGGTNLALRNLRSMLGYLAFYMLQKNLNEITESELIRQLNYFILGSLAAPVDAREFIDVVRDRSLILSEVGMTPDGDSVYMFRHQTFMEFFAGSYIASNPGPISADVFIAERLSNPQWRSTLNFALALADRDIAEQLLHGVAEQTQHLDPEIREQLRPSGRQQSAPNLALVEHGLKGHAHIQNDLAQVLRNAGIEPRSPRPSEPDFDLAWETDGTVFVAEVKSISDDNEEDQLRLGLGQVLDYRYRLERLRYPRVVAVLVSERAPRDSSWEDLCNELGVVLLDGSKIENAPTLASSAVLPTGRETTEKNTGIPAPAELKWRQALAPSEPFGQDWPRQGGGSVPEWYPHAWAGAITLAGSERLVVVGESTGDQRLDNRRRLLVLLDGYPTAEFAPTVDGRGWASVIKPDGRRTIPAGDPLPRLYRHARVEPYREATGLSGRGRPKGSAVVIDRDDIQSALHHAAARWLGRNGHAVE